MEPIQRRDIMKIYEKIIAIIASMSILSSSVVSCGKIEKKATPESSITNISTVDPMDLEELPRGEYEVSEVDYLGDIEHISDISPLNDNRYLVISDPSEYGDAATQKLYIADDQKSSVTEITPDLDLGVTAYYSALGTKDGRIFIAAIEPEYKDGKDPGHAWEENLPQEHIDFLFAHAQNVNYKLFELNTDGEVISENKLDFDYNSNAPISWLVCNDYWDDKLVISALIVSEKNYFDIETTDYVVNKNGGIEGNIENDIPYQGPRIKKAASDGRLCFVGTDYDADEPHDRMDFYDKDNYESSETVSVKCENFGCDKRLRGLIAGTFGHGDDLLYLSSCIGLFSYDKNGNYENIINYLDLLPEDIDETKAVVVLDDNSVFVLGSGYFINDDCRKTLVYKFKNIIAND